MKPLHLILPLLLLAGCNRSEERTKSAPSATRANRPQEKPKSLTEARQGFRTKLVRRESEKEPASEPPARLFRLVHYQSPAGKLAAYLSRNPGDGKKHPAIIWIFGGFSNSISEAAWEEMPAENDQSANAFRKAGIVMMYPSLRGGNDNPGFKEGFYGEVDDVLAAADFLAQQDFVDPKRIYLGGHSTGGTLAFLVAASSDRFRAVFSFGPVEDVRGYGPARLPFDPADRREVELRAPVRWVDSVRSPTFVFEGTERPGNLGSLEALKQASHNPLVHFYPVKGANHFSILAPMTRLIAAKINRDEGATTHIRFTQKEINLVFPR